MPITYDKNGNCTFCGMPGNGFVPDVCMCPEWTDADEAALEEHENRKRVRLAEANEY